MFALPSSMRMKKGEECSRCHHLPFLVGSLPGGYSAALPRGCLPSATTNDSCSRFSLQLTHDAKATSIRARK